MQNKNNRGFSLIELIVVVAIIATLSGTAYLGMQGAKRSSMNNKMLTDLVAIANALDQYRRDHNNSYPIPEAGSNMNVNCYYADATYAHDCSEAGDYSFIQGMIDNSLLGVKYLQEVPTDPRTGSRYAYGVSKDGKYFQVAGVWDDGTSYEARTADNIARGFNLPSLIRSYDSPNFVVDKGEYLPYSPDHLLLTARLQRFEGVTITSNGEAITDKDKIREFVLTSGDAVETSETGFTDIYFSDGTVSHLEAGSRLELTEMNIAQNDSKNIISKIRVLLSKGKIWNKVVRLASDSEFNIETSGAIAGVRGTEFSVDGNEVTVRSGKVAIYKKDYRTDDEPLNEVEAMQVATILSPANVSITAGDAETINTDYEKAFPKTMNSSIIPRILEADGQTVTFEKVAVSFSKIYSTLNDEEPLPFEPVTDGYKATYTPSPDPVRFYFEDDAGSRSGLSIQTVLNDLSEKISFKDVLDIDSYRPKPKWDISNPPSRLVAQTTDNNFSFTAAVLNQQELEEELEEGEFLSYKLIIYSPSVCQNRDTNTDFSMEGTFAINAISVGKCAYAVEVGAGELYPDHFDYSFGTSTPAKSVEVITEESFDVTFAVKTGEDCETGQTLESWDRATQTGGTHAGFGEAKLLLCADPSSEDGEVSYQWSSGSGMIDDETAKETFITIPKEDITGNKNGLAFEISLMAMNQSHTVDTETKSYHLTPPTVTSVSLAVVGSNIVNPQESLELKAEVSDSIFYDLTDEEKNITENCIWEISGTSSWHATPNKETIAVPEDAQSGDYTLTCTIPYLLNFDLAEAPLIATTTFKIPAPEDPFLVACVGADGEGRTGDETNGYTNSSKNTYYSPSGECWALGNATASVGENCTTTCERLTTDAIIVTCVDGSWNDYGSICQALAENETGTTPEIGNTAGNNYSPVWYLDNNQSPVANQCRSREVDDPFSGVATASCSAETENKNNRRVCKCVSQ